MAYPCLIPRCSRWPTRSLLVGFLVPTSLRDLAMMPKEAMGCWDTGWGIIQCMWALAEHSHLTLYSIWLDSKLRFNVDSMLIIKYFLWRKKAEYAISAHYDCTCVWEEVLQNKRLNKCARWFFHRVCPYTNV